MSAPGFTAIGVDVGGTKIAAAVVTFPEGGVHGRRVIPTLPHRGGAAVLADVEQLTAELAASSRAEGGRSLSHSGSRKSVKVL